MQIVSQTTYGYFENMLTRLYVITLSGIALLVICGQLTVQQGLDRRFNDGHLINLSCQQRMLAERVGKCALAIDASVDQVSIEQYAKEMEVALHDLSQNAEALQFGNSDLQLPDAQMGRNHIVFKQVEPDFQTMLKASRAMLANAELTKYAPAETRAQSTFTTQLLPSERRFAQGMKEIADDYQAGSESRIDELQNTELALLLTTVLSLLLAGVVIFRPAVGQVKAAIQLLEQTQGRLRTNEFRLSAILNSMAEGVIVIGRAGENLLINEAARIIHSMPPEKDFDVKDMDLFARYRFFHGDAKTELESHELPLYLALGGNDVDQAEIFLLPVDKSQKSFWLIATGRPLRGDNGEIVGALVVVQDITEKKLAEKRFNLFYAAADRALRTPLLAIKESLESIDGRQTDLPSEIVEKIRVGKVEIGRLVQLINELLDFPRLEAGTLELEYDKFNIKDMLVDSISQAKDLHNQLHENSQISINLSSDDVIMEADRARLQLVVQNLIANALSAIEDGVVEVAAHESGENLRVAVVDRGSNGRSDDASKSVLDFDTPGDFSLGLSVRKRIIEKHGGTMGFDGDVKKGSTFWFEVPLTRPKAKILMTASTTAMKAMQPNQSNQSNQSNQPTSQPEKSS
jgi:signal transduction histidine kinase